MIPSRVISSLLTFGSYLLLQNCIPSWVVIQCTSKVLIMKKTQFIDLYKNIQKTWVSFFSMVIFVILGIALFLSLTWGSESIEMTAAKEFSDYHMQDLEAINPYGFLESDIDKVRALDDVTYADGTYVDYLFFSHEGSREQAKVVALTENTNQLTKVLGNIPTKENEIAVEMCWAEKNNIKIGNHIAFIDDDTYTVTALVESPAYESNSPSSYGVSLGLAAPVSCVMFTDKSAFESKAPNGYTNILIYSDKLNENLFTSKEYRESSKELKEKVLDILDATVLNRDQVGGIVVINKTSEASGALSYSLSSLLVIISLLICYSTVTRIVKKQRILLGTKKALGFSRAEVTSFYMLYSGSAAILGSVIGVLIARFVLEPVIVSQMQNNFVMQTVVYQFDIKDALIISGIEIVLILLAAYIACASTLKIEATKLLAGDTPPQSKTRFYEKFGLWKKLPLLSKTIINNFFTDHMRVFATLVGIIGCTALLACGLSFNNSLLNTLPYHFESLQSYDNVVYYDGLLDSKESISDLLDAYKIERADAYAGFGNYTMPDGKSVPSSVVVSDDINFSKMFNLIDKEGNEGNLSRGVWLGDALADKYKLNVGDELLFTDSVGDEYKLQIDGICKYYGSGMMTFMDDSTYEKLSGKTYIKNAFLVNTGDISESDFKKLNAELNNREGFVLNYAFKKISSAEIEAVNGVFTLISGLYLGMSVAMALMVVLNLLKTFVSEKKKELIVLMINGYGAKQAKKYIYSDTILLSIVGIILGLLTGTLISTISINSIATETSHFIHGLNPMACLISVATTIVLIVIMSIISLREIDKFKLTDVNSVF